ncbi:glycosyltransferase family 39 protein [Halomonas sp. BM-2019]|uniref:glycosyltransferase family 39 protein n=1 Tax=Halomonas sp. BM-2019 TaxID=2811227 RepID=UPI001B3C4A77|nr:MAG: glycosyltransferase family 39 protein [Halomonas sp. BM-2019]
MVRSISNYAVYALVALGVSLSAIGVFYQYSYWWDELNSVVAAGLSLTEMFDIFILVDVHPPLYMMLLGAWVDLFGPGERQVRFLSFLFAASSLYFIASWARDEMDDVGFKTVILFFSTAPLFVFYSQEARSYAMMLFLASVLTTCYLKSYHLEGMKRFFIFSCLSVLLSLTHYFGFVYAGLIIIFSLFESRREIRRSLSIVFTGLVCFIWPAIHLFKGSVGEKSGDNFWIKSEGFQSTISSLSSGLTPQINILAGKLGGEMYREYLAALVFIILFVLVVALARKGRGLIKSPGSSILLKLTALVSFFALIMIAIDYHSPISTRRNYIVLLPAFSILLGLAVQGMKSIGFKYLMVAVVIGGIGNIGIASVNVKSKVSPMQNNSGAVEYIEEENSEGDNIYYLARNGTSMPEVQKMMAEFYFSDDDIEIEPVFIEDIYSIESPFFMLMQQQSHDLDEIVDEFRSVGAEVGYITPQRNQSVAVLYSK